MITNKIVTFFYNNISFLKKVAGFGEERLYLGNKKRGSLQSLWHGGCLGEDGGYLLSHLVGSTIGAAGLNFSVRDGKRWNPGAIATWSKSDMHWQHQPSLVTEKMLVYPTDNTIQQVLQQVTQQVIQVTQREQRRGENSKTHTPAQKPRAISSARLWCRHLYTCALSTSSSMTTLKGDLILRPASCLDAFSIYPVPA